MVPKICTNASPASSRRSPCLTPLAAADSSRREFGRCQLPPALSVRAACEAYAPVTSQTRNALSYDVLEPQGKCVRLTSEWDRFGNGYAPGAGLIGSLGTSAPLPLLRCAGSPGRSCRDPPDPRSPSATARNKRAKRHQRIPLTLRLCSSRTPVLRCQDPPHPDTVDSWKS